ncbi:MAG: hypothetical protein NC916_00885, partial [Candidatus Omnitrophica bacterium]|nr:hypothetical protein [Candidatus Omnitrophota bacterium]
MFYQPKRICLFYLSGNIKSAKDILDYQKIKSFINSQENLFVFKVYSDAGFSGANNLERPGLQVMLRDIQEN